MPMICHCFSSLLSLIVIQSPTFSSGRIFNSWLPMTTAFLSSGVSQRPAVMIGWISVELDGGAMKATSLEAFAVLRHDLCVGGDPAFHACHAGVFHGDLFDILEIVRAGECRS